jgi:toxin CcdB
MPQFDIYRLPSGTLVVDCQADLLSYLQSRFVVPLLPPDLVEASGGLNPRFNIHGQALHFFPQGAATVQTAELREQVGSLGGQSYVVLNAIDFLLTGV